MSKWDYMDKKVWDSSIVMKEFEKIYKESKMPDANEINAATNAMRAFNTEAAKLKDAMGGAADDGETEKKQKPKAKNKSKVKKKRVNTKDKKVLKAQIINELVSISSQAINDLDYKLAYEVEKTIKSLECNEE